MDAVLHAASNTAEDFPGGTTGMAGALCKNKFSLMHELSGTGAAKLGLIDALKMVKRSGDFRIINAAAAECGGIFVPLPEAFEGSDPLLNLAELAKEFSDLIAEVTGDVRDAEISSNEMARLNEHWGRLVAAGQHMMVQLRGRFEESQQRGSRGLKAV
jgi:hypothetical protein